MYQRYLIYHGRAYHNKLQLIINSKELYTHFEYDIDKIHMQTRPNRWKSKSSVSATFPYVKKVSHNLQVSWLNEYQR